VRPDRGRGLARSLVARGRVGGLGRLGHVEHRLDELEGAVVATRVETERGQKKLEPLKKRGR
jgi:hypothetical protein